MGYKVAIVGATGNVGREMLDVLADRKFPADEVIPLASRRSIGVEVSYGDRRLKCRDLETFDFSQADFCLMSAGSTISKEWSPRIAAKGCTVIDNSSCWRYDPDVPLIVPEVNADAIIGFTKKNIIANPNCSTAQLVVALKPLHDHAPNQARCCLHLPISVWRRQGGHGRAVVPNQGQIRPRPRGRSQEVSKGNCLQLYSSNRCLHGGRLHQGGMEDGRGN